MDNVHNDEFSGQLSMTDGFKAQIEAKIQEGIKMISYVWFL